MGASLAPSIACALSTAWRAASTRDVWPEPRPTSRPSRTRTMAFEVDAADQPPGEVEVGRSRSVGRAAGGDRPGRRVVRRRCPASSTRTAPPAVRIDPVGIERPGGGRPPAERPGRRRAAGSAWRRGPPSALGVERRARRRPRGRSRRAPRPRAASTGRVSADDAAEGRDRVAREGRLARPRGASARSAAPHGLVCLTMTHGRPAQRPAERGRGRCVEHVVVATAPCPGAAARRSRTGRPPASLPGSPVARRRLVRVLAVAQRLDLLERDRQRRRVRVRGAGQARLVGQVDAGAAIRRGSSAAIRAS